MREQRRRLLVRQSSVARVYDVGDREEDLENDEEEDRGQGLVDEEMLAMRRATTTRALLIRIGKAIARDPIILGDLFGFLWSAVGIKVPVFIRGCSLSCVGCSRSWAIRCSGFVSFPWGVSFPCIRSWPATGSDLYWACVCVTLSCRRSDSAMRYA
jgi:hypothetical protein